MTKAYCINLRDRVDRWARFYNHFSAHKMYAEKFEGLDAVKWGLITKNAYEKDHPGTGFHMPQKHVGLHLSHYWLWRQIARLNDEPVIVFEDDARYCGQDDNPVALLGEYADWVRKMTVDQDNGLDHPIMLFLGSCNCGHKEGPLVDETLKIRQIEWPQCTHAYMLNKSAANLLIRTQEKSWAPIDLALIFESFPEFAKNRGGVYTVQPRIFDQEGQIIYP